MDIELIPIFMALVLVNEFVLPFGQMMGVYKPHPPEELSAYEVGRSILHFSVPELLFKTGLYAILLVMLVHKVLLAAAIAMALAAVNMF